MRLVDYEMKVEREGRMKNPTSLFTRNQMNSNSESGKTRVQGILSRQSLLFFVAASSFFLGCTKFSQDHYVGVVDKKSGNFQFYRFRLRGNPGLNRVKFVTGWYDAAALDSLAKEHHSSLDGSDQQAGDTPQAASDKSGAPSMTAENFWITGPEGRAIRVDDKRFAIIMATDPQPILDAVDKFSELGSVIKEAKDKQKVEKNRKSKLCKALKSALKKGREANPTDARFNMLGELLPAVLGDCLEDAEENGNETPGQSPGTSSGG